MIGSIKIMQRLHFVLKSVLKYVFLLACDFETVLGSI